VATPTAAAPGAAAGPALDPYALRADFPIFEREVGGRPLAYLDSASSAQKPRQVLDAMTRMYERSYANVHRSVYPLAEEATEAYEAARRTVQRFVGAADWRECIFTRNATEAINLVAYAWGTANCGPGDVIVATEMEHHSNLVPWQYLAHRTGASIRFVHLRDDGQLALEELDGIAAEGRVKLLAAVHQSNSLGTVNPIRRLADWAHERGAVLVVDGAQSAPHRRIDVQALGCDFFAFSGHKICGPTGAGALWGRRELLAGMEPFLCGGEMIRSVKLDATSWNELPWKFEAGTPAIVECVGMGAAIDYLDAVGMEAIERHEREITSYAYARLSEIEGVRIIGPGAAERGGLVSFSFGDLHPHDIAQVLGDLGVCVRAGHHCTQPAMRRYGLPATTRASFYLYTVPEEVDRLCEGLERVREVFA
jgi:cysteine desulfurase/selenocysteine lyase